MPETHGFAMALAWAMASAAACVSPQANERQVEMILEIPMGSREKIEYRDGRFVVDRVLPVETGGYPVNYGFIPCTQAPDGDPVDALLPGRPSPTGTRLQVRVVGLLQMADEKGEDAKVLVVAPGGPEWTNALRRDVASFFGRYKRNDPDRWSRVQGWKGPTQAVQWLERSTFDRECEPDEPS